MSIIMLSVKTKSAHHQKLCVQNDRNISKNNKSTQVTFYSMGSGSAVDQNTFQ